MTPTALLARLGARPRDRRPRASDRTRHRPLATAPNSVPVTVVLVAVAAVAAVLALAAPAQAHSDLVATDPASGARVGTVPAVVTLTFNEPIEPRLVRTRVEWPGGGSAVRSDVDRTVVRVPVGGLPAVAAVPASSRSGDYTVVYRVVSRDGHPVSGRLTFTVLAAPDASRTATAPPSTATTAATATAATATAAGATAPATTVPRAAAPEATMTTTPDPASRTSFALSPGVVGLAALVLAVGAAVGLVLRARRSPRGSGGSSDGASERRQP